MTSHDPVDLGTRLSEIVSATASQATGLPVAETDTVIEARLISTAINEPLYMDFLDNIRAQDFSVPVHASIWTAVHLLHSQGAAIDTVTVCATLEELGLLAHVGGTQAVTTISESTVLGDDVATYRDVLLSRALRRRILRASGAITSSAHSLPPEELAEFAQREIYSACSTEHIPAVVTAAELAEQLRHETFQERTAGLVGVSSGFKGLDEVTNGFSPGQLIVVGARPGVGKSVLLLQIARHIARTSKNQVLLYSYEMSASEIGFRLLAEMSGVPLPTLMRGGSFTGAQHKRINQAVEHISALPLTINDNPPPSVTGLRADARRVSRSRALGAIVVDYLQLMRGDGKRHEGRVQEVSEMSRELKLTAKELHTPVIAASQLNRQIENRQGDRRRPQLSDLRESGSVEQDSNVVLFLDRPATYDPSAPADQATLIVGKNRQGRSGVDIALRWFGETVHFEEEDPVATRSDF